MSLHGFLKMAKTTHNSSNVVNRRLKTARQRLDFQVHPSLKRPCDTNALAYLI